MLDATLSVNERQPRRLVEAAGQDGGYGRTIAVLGLAFKPGTDDIREAQLPDGGGGSATEGAMVRSLRPAGHAQLPEGVPPADLLPLGQRECLEGADAALIVTEWKEFADPALYGARWWWTEGA